MDVWNVFSAVRHEVRVSGEGGTLGTCLRSPPGPAGDSQTRALTQKPGKPIARRGLSEQKQVWPSSPCISEQAFEALQPSRTPSPGEQRPLSGAVELGAHGSGCTRTEQVLGPRGAEVKSVQVVDGVHDVQLPVLGDGDAAGARVPGGAVHGPWKKAPRQP